MTEPKPGSLRDFFRNNCPVLQRTGNGVPVGRCWHYLRNGLCPIHGDVSAAVDTYIATGRYTDEAELPARVRAR